MDGERTDLACILRELWLLRSNTRGTERAQLLASDCTRDVHEQPPAVVDVAPARVRYTPEPSAGQDSLDFALDPPALTLETHVSGGITFTWLWPTFRGQACADGTCVPVLPDVRLADNFAHDGWKTTALGACSMLVDGGPGDTSQGFVSGGKATAAMRLLLSEPTPSSERTLYVEVTDDVFVTKGDVVDTLDVGSWSVNAMTAEGASRHRRLRMDGRLTDETGAKRNVDVVIGPGMRRFALPGELMTGLEQWEVSYEDTDDGRTRAARLSTGPHEMPPPRFAAPEGACVVKEGGLRVVQRGLGP